MRAELESRDGAGHTLVLQSIQQTLENSVLATFLVRPGDEQVHVARQLLPSAVAASVVRSADE